jgi:FAD/FMN-containing dehydrogenase
MNEVFEPKEVSRKTAALSAELSQLEWITDASRVEKLSQDFAWFSPILKRDLAGLKADAVVRPTTQEQIVDVVAQCAKHGIPITARGSGTGNYGQCTPLHGGVVLDLSAYNKMLWVGDGKIEGQAHLQPAGVARAQAGMRMIEFDKATQAKGFELRCVPSTFRSATIGGLYGGGFGGIGSINYGPLASTGNVLGCRAVTIEPEPKIVDLRAPDALLLHHVYGTNGLVLELELALGPAHAWNEIIVCFDDFDKAINFADAVANAPGIAKKSVTFLAAPIPDYLTLLAKSLEAGKHAVLIAYAAASEIGVLQIAKEFGGSVSMQKTAAEVTRTNRTILEYTWNHTTLHALKVDKTLTYIQSGFTAGKHLEQARAMRKLFGDEVMLHLEFIRSKEGMMTCSGLQLVRYSTEKRLNEIMQLHRDNGVYIANPHVFMVEDGKQGMVNPDVVATKMRFDPQGLLNPGKLRGWAMREQIMADAKAGKVSLATLPKF